MKTFRRSTAAARAGLLVVVIVAVEAVGPFVAVGGAGRALASDAAFGRLSVDQVAGKIGKPGVFVYDNNSKEDYAEGHVPSSKWLEYDAVKGSDLPGDKSATLIFYCANEH